MNSCGDGARETSPLRRRMPVEKPATILIIAPREDIHARTVAAAAEKHGVPAVIFDTADVPSVDRATLGFNGQTTGFAIRAAGPELRFEDVRSVWWRRPSSPRIAAEVEDDLARQFCVRETEMLLRGALDACGVRIINDPAAQVRAARKPLQLARAQSIGLAIPRTVMSNDPDRVRDLYEETAGRCVYKTFTAPTGRMAETRRLTAEVLTDLERLRHAPIIAQELVDGRDVRVTVIGDRVFAALAGKGSPSAPLDGRLDLATVWEPHELPDQTRRRLLSLLHGLGLDYGCIDLRWQGDGRYVFLEINPAGQFLFIEIDTGQPLVQSLLELLLEPRPR
jgi:glutathione synthase/RimK-type ligase-like ATP-grasp enzyme